VSDGPVDRHQLREARLKKRVSARIYRTPLLRSNDVGHYSLPRDRLVALQRVRVQKTDQAAKGVGLPLVRRRREQQEIRRGLGQGVAELETGNLLGAPAEPVGFVDDDQIPAGGDQVLEPLSVVAGELVLAPAPAQVDRLHRVERAYCLIAHPPEVRIWVGRTCLPQSREAFGQDKTEVLVEMGFHFRLPLQHQPSRRDDEHAFHQTADLQFSDDEASLDGLAEPHFVGKEVADAVAGSHALEGIELVRQRNDRAFKRRHKRVSLQSIRDTRGRAHIGQPVEQLVVGCLQRRQSALKNASGRAAAWQPDDAGGLTPKRIALM
jgi:hypothetical protein